MVTFESGDLHLRIAFEDDARLTFNRWPRVELGGRVLRQGDPGYSDALISLGMQSVVSSARETAAFELELQFDDGTRLSVPLGGTFDDMASYDVAVLNNLKGPFVLVRPAGEMPEPAGSSTD